MLTIGSGTATRIVLIRGGGMLAVVFSAKVFIETLASGVDFLGWVHFPQHRVLRTVTKRRMLRNLATGEVSENTIVSYSGLLSHGNAWKLRNALNH